MEQSCGSKISKILRFRRFPKFWLFLGAIISSENKLAKRWKEKRNNHFCGTIGFGRTNLEVLDHGKWTWKTWVHLKYILSLRVRLEVWSSAYSFDKVQFCRANHSYMNSKMTSFAWNISLKRWRFREKNIILPSLVIWL